MKVAFSAPGQDRIEQAFQAASSTTGASFDYLVKTAIRESNLDPSAKARTSSAAGTFQFIESTWLETVKEAGGRFGLDKYAEAIQRTSKGSYTVPDATMRKEILDLRHDPEVSALMAGALTQKNSDILESHLGRPPSDGELYIAHFLGASGAKRLISLADSQPDANASSHFSVQAKANKPIFFNRDGSARTAEAVYNNLVNRHDGTQLIGTALASIQPKPKPISEQIGVALAVTPLDKPDTPPANLTPVDRIATGWNIASASDEPAGVAAALRVAAGTAAPVGNRFDNAFRIAEAATRTDMLAFAGQVPATAEAGRDAQGQRPEPGAGSIVARAWNTLQTTGSAAPEALPEHPVLAAYQAREPRTAFESLYRTDGVPSGRAVGDTFALAYSAQTSLFSSLELDAIESLFGRDNGIAARSPVAEALRSAPMDLNKYRRADQAAQPRELLPPV